MKRTWLSRIYISIALLCGCQNESAPQAYEAASPAPTAAGSAGTSAEGSDDLPIESSSGPKQLEEIDPALRAALIRARQLDAGEEFHVRRTERGATAVNRPTMLELRYEAERVSLTRLAATDTEDALEAELRFTAIGRDGVWAPAPQVEQVETSENLVVYERTNIVEQYLNGPLGLEQFFTIAEPPAGTGRVELVVDIGGDLSPRLAEHGQYVELRDTTDEPVMKISELFVTDATGRTLSSELQVRDGRVVLVFDDNEATYPIEVDPLVTSLHHERSPADPLAGAQFGYSVAVHENLSSMGPHALIGAPYAGNGGAAYLFKYDVVTRNWTQTAKLVPGSAAENNGCGFGISAAIGGQGMLFVGAPYCSGNEGRVFIFDKDSSGTWVQRFKIGLFSPAANDRFGASVSAVLFDLLVGVPGREVGSVQNAGKVAVFTAFYVNNGTTPAVSVPTEVQAPTAAANEYFGSSVAFLGTQALIGAPSATVSGTAGAGRVYVYKKSGSSIAHVQTLTPPAPTSSGRFGADVELASGPCPTGTCTEFTGIVSEPGADPNGTDSGSAHVYVNTNSTSPSYTFQKTLNPPWTGSNFANYYNVTIETFHGTGPKMTRAVIGPSSAGSAPVVIFERLNGTWNMTPTTIAVPSTSPSSRFGSAIALHPDHASQLIAGAPLSDRAATDAGRAFFYNVGFSNGMACTSDAVCNSGNCIDGVCCNSRCGGVTTDCQACSTAAGGTTNGTCTALSSAAAATKVCRAADPSRCRQATTCSTTETTCPFTIPPSPSSTVCRPKAGPCDAADYCTGTATECPADAFTPYDPFTACRGSINIFCDPAEFCSGSSPQCPSDVNMCF